MNSPSTLSHWIHLWRENPPTTTPQVLNRLYHDLSISYIIRTRELVYVLERNACVAFVILWPRTITITITNPKSTILIHISHSSNLFPSTARSIIIRWESLLMAAPTNENVIIFFIAMMVWLCNAFGQLHWVQFMRAASNFSKFEVSILHQFFQGWISSTVGGKSMLCMYWYIKDIGRYIFMIFKKPFKKPWTSKYSSLR